MDATVDEVFSWGDDMGRKAKDRFGCHFVSVSMTTFSEIKERCARIDSDNEAHRFPDSKPLNSISITVRDGIPDGIMRSNMVFA
jgi:hypothetical protein